MRSSLLVLASLAIIACDPSSVAGPETHDVMTQGPDSTAETGPAEVAAPAPAPSAPSAPASAPPEASPSAPASVPPAAPSASTGQEVQPAPVPPPSANVGNTTLEALRALSPTLRFDELVIRGELTLPAGTSVGIQARRFELTDTARIDVAWSACNYGRTPDFSVLASEQIVINGRIDLSGKHGDETPNESTCRSCGGVPGGTLTLVSDVVRIGTSADVDTSGGWGSSFVMMVSGQVLRSACDGGAGGDIVLSATTVLEVAGAMRFRGGEGGVGSGFGAGVEHGDDGARGAVMWDADEIKVTERDPNALRSTAQPLALAPLTVAGSVYPYDDLGAADSTDSIIANYAEQTDLIEDLYVIENTETTRRTVEVELIGASTNLDIDLIIADHTGLGLVTRSVTPAAHERVTFIAEPGQRYFIGVSLCSRGTANYALVLRPQP